MQLSTSKAFMPKNSAVVLTCFLVGLVAIFTIPIINVAPQYQTFIHSFRPEMALGIYILAFSIWGLFTTEFKSFLLTIQKHEWICILLPMILFICWSISSAVWAASYLATWHHTLLWICYLNFYLLSRYFFERFGSVVLFFLSLIGFILVIILPPLIESYTVLFSGNTPSLGLRYSKYTELINTLTPLIVAFGISAKGKLRTLAIATVVTVWLFDLATVSRAGNGVFLVTTFLLLISVFSIKRYRVYRTQMAGIAAAIVLASLLSLGVSFLASSQLPLIARINDPSTSESTNVRPLFAGIALEMWKSHKTTGIGSDNYGREFSVYRSMYAENLPLDPNLKIISLETSFPERAHNEYLQVLAELGIVGGLIFAIFLLGIGSLVVTVLRRKFRVNLITTSAFIGIFGFLLSSLVSSYSFRIPQNGLAFFLVLAVAVSGVLRPRRKIIPVTNSQSSGLIILGLVVSLLASIALLTYSSARLAAVHYLLTAEQQQTVDEALPFYHTALKLDPENGNAYSSLGGNLLHNGRPADAPPYLRKAIQVGRSTSVDFSLLATAQIVADDRASAIMTLREGIRVYPFSVFLRARYAVALKDNGQNEESLAEFEAAKQIDSDQASVWFKYIDSGGYKASIDSFEKGLPSLMELKPQVAIYAIKRERELRFPEEKVVIPPQ